MSRWVAAPASATAAISFSIRIPPANIGVSGRCPRGAGRAIVLYGQAFSPSHIRPSSVCGIQPGASNRLSLNGTPRARNHSKCSTLPSQYSRSFSSSACGPSAALRKANMSSGVSSKPHAFCTRVPPPRYSSPPDCADVPPGPLDRSRTRTSAPAAAASYAAAAPAAPKPTTSTSHSWSTSTSAAATGSTEGLATGVSPSSAA
nr:hypothetical protein [Actinomadura madurae]